MSNARGALLKIWNVEFGMWNEMNSQFAIRNEWTPRGAQRITSVGAAGCRNEKKAPVELFFVAIPFLLRQQQSTFKTPVFLSTQSLFRGGYYGSFFLAFAKRCLRRVHSFSFSCRMLNYNGKSDNLCNLISVMLRYRPCQAPA